MPFCLCLGLNQAVAQKIKEAEVPAQVRDAFKKLYPEAKVEEWEKEDAFYEAEFDNKKEETTVTFDILGNLIETEVEIKASELPASAQEFLTKNAKGKKIKEACRITDAAGKVTYEAEAGDTEYHFEDKGNFISKEQEKEGLKDDKDKD